MQMKTITEPGLPSEVMIPLLEGLPNVLLKRMAVGEYRELLQALCRHRWAVSITDFHPEVEPGCDYKASCRVCGLTATLREYVSTDMKLGWALKLADGTVERSMESAPLRPDRVRACRMTMLAEVIRLWAMPGSRGEHPVIIECVQPAGRADEGENAHVGTP